MTKNWVEIKTQSIQYIQREGPIWVEVTATVLAIILVVVVAGVTLVQYFSQVY